MRNSKNKNHWLRRWVPILAVVLVLCLGALVWLHITAPLEVPDETAPSVTETTGVMEPTQTVPPTEPTQVIETTEATEVTETTEVTEATEATEATEPVQTKPQPTEPKPTEPERQPTVPPTEATQPTQPEKTENPANLTEMLTAGGYSYDDISRKDCTQLVTVVANGNKAKIRFFTLENGLWEEQSDLYATGYVGRNGVSKSKKEGDGCTPWGLYSIGTGFYISTKPATSLELFRITDDTYWVDDPDSVYYNQRVEGTENKDWNSAEKMGSYKTAYQYGFVVDYNTDCVPGAGSAIFFHVGSKSTAGCIAVKEKMVLNYLAALDAGCNPYILILSE